MNGMAMIALALLAAALTDCRSVQPTQAATAHQTASRGLQCQMQHVTGTLIAVRVCTLKEQRDQMHQDTQDVRDFLNRQIHPACPGTPGCGN